VTWPQWAAIAVWVGTVPPQIHAYRLAKIAGEDPPGAAPDHGLRSAVWLTVQSLALTAVAFYLWFAEPSQ
jgi:hypothetical protein